jgi:hypothetical protein
MEPKRPRDDQEEDEDTPREQHMRHHQLPSLPMLVHHFFNLEIE